MAITRQREAGAFDYWDKEELQTEVLGREIEENALIEFMDPCSRRTSRS